MRGRGLLVLVVLAAALAAGLYLTRGSAAGEGETLQEPVLGAHRIGEVLRIVIRNQPDVPPIEIAQEAGGQFVLREPIRDAVSEAWLQAFADSWNSAMMVRAFAADQVDAGLLEQHGLANPRAEITLTFADADALHFDIGEVGPLGHLFLRREGVIYRAAADLYSSIQGTPDDLREHVIFRNRPNQVRRWQMRRRQGDGSYETLVVERRGSDYRLTAPIESPAADGAVRVLLTQMLGLRLEAFMPGNVREPEQPADFVIEVEGERGTETVSLWRRDQTLTAVHEERGMGFSLSLRTTQSLFAVTAEDLRLRVLIPFVVDDARRLTLDPGAGRGAITVLGRDASGGFRLQQPVDAPVNPSAVVKLMQALRRLGAVEFVTSAPGDDLTRYGLGDGALSLAMLGPTQAKPTELRFGDDVAPAGGGDKNLTYCYAVGDALVVKTPKAVVDALRLPWYDLVGLQVYRNERPIDVGRLLYRGAETKTFVRGADGRFRAQGEEMARDKVGEVVAELCDLKATRAVPEAEVPSQGRIDLVLQRDTGDELRTITLAEAGERIYARQSRLEVWFELPSLDRVLLEAFR